MKIALAQLNYHIGNFELNTKLIIEAIEKAKLQKADIVIFSELSVCGYPPQDLLEQKEFIFDCKKSADKIVEVCDEIAAVIGLPTINESPKGKKLFNSAYFIYDKKIQTIHHKTLLPTYDIFDEYRYFESNTDFALANYKNQKIAITICEDLWHDQPVENSFAKNKLYRDSPLERLKKLNPDFVINISASPFSYTQEEVRKNVLADNAKKYNLPIFYVNQVGAQTELIFDGGSQIVNSEGNSIKSLKYFEEDFLIFDLDELELPASEKSELNMQKPEIQYIAKIHDALVLGIKDYFAKMNFKSATLGLSGGIDSAVTLVLAVKALGKENLRVLLMPSKYSSDHSIKDAIDLAKNLGIKYDVINIEEIVSKFELSLNELFKECESDLTEENIQARIRGTLLMALSNKFGNILLNTSNKSEAAVGYGTLYGDMNGGLSVLGDVYKTDVFRLAEFINIENEIIPINTIEKPPSAELRPDQKDSDSLPDYDILDDVLYNYIEMKKSYKEIIEQGFDSDLVKRIIKMVNNNEYKRFQTPPILRISSKAFGMGRRMPLVAMY
ncbi:MAG: NAD+ synthase [Bacteroidetes bacterium]|jgi:NAD+ synthase (glutamine-hydrolysing)|nr:NAD+ synthase [Bacteroidota bacterium]MBT6688063.1 NAD+ synthase [Bacteroidota bacterium]MBT7145015.1 NAD+ synthase [Bacteroidota bacterium]MBT7492071.1 NAD+ synthase [Bacteroidota bacterium]